MAHLGATDEAHRRQPKAVRFDGTDGRCRHVGVVGQPQVVVGAGERSKRERTRRPTAGQEHCRTAIISACKAAGSPDAVAQVSKRSKTCAPEVEHWLGGRLHACGGVARGPLCELLLPGAATRQEGWDLHTPNMATLEAVEIPCACWLSLSRLMPAAHHAVPVAVRVPCVKPAR